jgi:hypothetical protein
MLTVNHVLLTLNIFIRPWGNKNTFYKCWFTIDTLGAVVGFCVWLRHMREWLLPIINQTTDVSDLLRRAKDAEWRLSKPWRHRWKQWQWDFLLPTTGNKICMFKHCQLLLTEYSLSVNPYYRLITSNSLNSPIEFTIAKNISPENVYSRISILEVIGNEKASIIIMKVFSFLY